jgi:hypothetical protein
MIRAPLGKLGINHNFKQLTKEGDHAKTVSSRIPEQKRTQEA